MKEKLVRQGNAVYEIDEECMKERKKQSENAGKGGKKTDDRH